MKRRCWFLLLMLWCGCAYASENDSVPQKTPYTSHHQLRTPFLNKIYQFVKDFSRVDTNYIEPQHYNYAFMLQNTNTYEVYHMSNEKGQEVVFSPRSAYRLGPYFGWRWIFLGYTVDLTHLKNSDRRVDFNVSLYSNQIGLDLFYRKSGNSYRVKRVSLGDGCDTSPMKNANFGGFNSSVKGFNIYYIFNHKKFSYPAAYSQTTVQRRSCGSVIAGVGYTKHKLDVDWKAFNQLLVDRLQQSYPTQLIDSTMMSSNVNYSDYSLSGGYAYNWVFAYNWLFDISLQTGLSYKHTTSDTNTSANKLLRNFDLKNIDIDGILRLGVVWNNTRWFAGANTILHAYNYHRSQFSTNNIFGNVNFYVGFNFGKR